MAIGNTSIHNTNTNSVRGLATEHTAAPQQQNGVVARGVGPLRKVWLQLTRQAGERHKTQLANLRVQVRHQFGEGGLMVLNDKLSAQKWDNAGSKKIFSKSELNSLRKEAKEGAGLAEFKMGLHQELEAKLRAPALEKADAARTAETDRNERIEATIPGLLHNNGDQLITALTEGSHVSRFEAIQGSYTVNNAANEVLNNPSVSFMMGYALPYLKLDPNKDIKPEMIKDMMAIAERHCVPDAMQEVTLPNQELDVLMKDAMVTSLISLKQINKNGSDSEKIQAVREFIAGNLQDFYSHASDMYFDELDNAPTEALLKFSRAAYAALPELAHAEATRIVDSEKSNLVAAERAIIEQNLRLNLANRESYPDASLAIIDLELAAAKSALNENITIPRHDHLRLIDDLARLSIDKSLPYPFMLEQLGNLANKILDDDAVWADHMPPEQRTLIKQRAGDMEKAAGKENESAQSHAGRNFLDTLDAVSELISASYYHNYLANDPQFSSALNDEATNVVNKQIHAQRMAAT